MTFGLHAMRIADLVHFAGSVRSNRNKTWHGMQKYGRLTQPILFWWPFRWIWSIARTASGLDVAAHRSCLVIWTSTLSQETPNRLHAMKLPPMTSQWSIIKMDVWIVPFWAKIFHKINEICCIISSNVKSTEIIFTENKISFPNNVLVKIYLSKWQDDKISINDGNTIGRQGFNEVQLKKTFRLRN